MKLYKFTAISPRAITSIVTGKFWASTLDRLNDPFEDRFADDAPLIQQLVQIIQQLVQTCGVFCISGHEPNGRDVLREPLMWTHYASNHSGIAIGLKPIHGKNGLTRVRYLSLENINKHWKKMIEEHKKNNRRKSAPWADIVFGFKMNYWEYENEYRIVAAGAANTYIDPSMEIDEVVFGFKSRPEEELAIWSALRDKIKYRKVTNKRGMLEVDDYVPPSKIKTGKGAFLICDKAGAEVNDLSSYGRIEKSTFEFK